MERSTIFKNGKPSISMGHLYHGYVTNNQGLYTCSPSEALGLRQNWTHENMDPKFLRIIRDQKM